MKTLAMMLALAVVAPAAFVACDRTAEVSTETHSTDGTVRTEKKTVTETPTGDVKVTEEKKKVDTH